MPVIGFLDTAVADATAHLVLAFQEGLRAGCRALRRLLWSPPGAPREAGCPPWVVLGVKAVEASSVRAA
jgi:hypothetical protein